MNTLKPGLYKLQQKIICLPLYYMIFEIALLSGRNIDTTI